MSDYKSLLALAMLDLEAQFAVPQQPVVLRYTPLGEGYISLPAGVFRQRAFSN